MLTVADLQYVPLGAGHNFAPLLYVVVVFYWPIPKMYVIGLCLVAEVPKVPRGVTAQLPPPPSALLVS